MSEGRFTDKEVGAIIQRATELHDRAGGESRLSLEDVERIAAEMGLPASFVHAAAAEVGPGSQPTRTGPFAIPRIEVSATLPGPVDDERWAHIVQLLRKNLGGAGETETIGNVHYWNRTVFDMGSEVSRSDASIRSGDDVSVLEIHRTGVPIYRALAQIGGAVAGGGFFALLMVAGDVGPAIGISGMLAGGLAGLGTARVLLANSAKKQIGRLSELASHIATVTVPGASAAPLDPVGTERLANPAEPEAGLSLEDLPSSADESTSDSVRNRERS